MSDDHVLGPELLPTPFSAAEIRTGCPVGRTVVVRVDEADGVRHRLSRFAAVTAEGATYERADCDADGTVLGDVTSMPLTWLDLQRHAAFPAAVTARDEATLEYPLGVADCWRYVVRDEAEVTTFWFAKNRAGMPVKVTSQRGDAVLSTTVMVSDRVVALPPD
ncbi:hypothetical protein [Knoellia subterranea]|uniref:Uncharacterized protein n=1 Tax=Knoellia subterranea KCTC 19937 TaxID=1385521 RepID=A0A0A0JM01_9MICO|nr:hypothetical protein [Knoellia subterranea]KGN37047.1 hypothetical protein N803_16655 [Knoellia subterranea KCTC 19937]